MTEFLINLFFERNSTWHASVGVDWAGIIMGF